MVELRLETGLGLILDLSLGLIYPLETFFPPFGPVQREVEAGLRHWPTDHSRKARDFAQKEKGKARDSLLVLYCRLPQNLTG